MPVTGSVRVDKKKVMELVDQLRLAIPQEVRGAQEVLGRKDQILNQALTDARRTKVHSEEELRERLDKSEVVRQAQKKAEETVKEAEQRAERLLQQAQSDAQARRNEADAYALRTLRALERELGSLSNSVRKGIDLLAGDALAVDGHRSRE